MPFQPINFANIPTQGNPMAQNLMESLMKGYQMGQIPSQMRQKSQEQELSNALQQLQVQQSPQKFKSEMESETFKNELMKLKAERDKKMLPYEINEQDLKNKSLELANEWYPKLTQSKLDSNKALTKQRDLGLTGLGVGGKEQLYFNRSVGEDNPDLNESQIRQAANAYLEGKDTLADGTPLKPMSPSTRQSLDRLVKYGTTASLINNAVATEQAEVEIPVMQDYAIKAMAPYADTIFNRSPQQFIDSFKTDKESQKRLGKAIAGQQLQFDLSQAYIRLARAKPGVTITNELMEIGKQRINDKYPKISGVAREEASRYLYEALSAANNAMKKVPLGASGTLQKPENETQNKTQNRLKYNPSTGDFE
jgi:hypothetical protein